MSKRAIAVLVASGLASAPVMAQTTSVWSTPTTTQQVDPRKMENPDVVARPGPLEGMVVGSWDLWVPGGVWYSSDGRSVYRNYTPGAAINRLTIRPDGSYQWASQQGRLVEIRPWFAQEGQRFYAVAMDGANRYMARWDADQDRLLLFFWGVGGHAATGTRIGQAPSAPQPRNESRGASRPDAAQPVGTTVRYTGTATNSGVNGQASITLTSPASGGNVRGSATFSGGLGGEAKLQGTLQREQLNLNGEMLHNGVRYTMIVLGRITAQGELAATYTLTALDRAGFKQSGTISARAEGTAAGASPATRPGQATTAPSSGKPTASAPAPAGNPLGVEWIGGNPSPAPATASTDPACAPNPLGVVWVQCQNKAAAAAEKAASALVRSWRYQSLQVRTASGEVRDHSDQVNGTFTLNSDGTFVQDLRIGTQRAGRSGRYSIDGEKLQLQGSGGQRATLWFQIEDGRLWLQEEQNGTALRYGLTQP